MSAPVPPPADRARWDLLDTTLVTLRTCATVGELTERACELAMRGCGAEAAALGRWVADVWTPWLRAGRVELLEVGEQAAHPVSATDVVVRDAVVGQLRVAGPDLSVEVVNSYGRALGSMFALFDVRQRVEEQRYALARLRRGLADGGERPIELIGAGPSAADLRGARTGAPSSRVTSSALRARLTARQREVLDLMVAGLSNAEIAERLVVALPTVKSHVRAVLRVSGAVNRSDALTRLARAGRQP